jgi:hypothetical protein
MHWQDASGTHGETLRSRKRRPDRYNRYFPRILRMTLRKLPFSRSRRAISFSKSPVLIHICIRYCRDEPIRLRDIIVANLPSREFRRIRRNGKDDQMPPQPWRRLDEIE